jgi:hypothetical protein
MAGLEYGPAKKKVSTFRGERGSAKWEENRRTVLPVCACLGGLATNKIPKAGGIAKIPVLFAPASSDG